MPGDPGAVGPPEPAGTPPTKGEVGGGPGACDGSGVGVGGGAPPGSMATGYSLAHIRPGATGPGIPGPVIGCALRVGGTIGAPPPGRPGVMATALGGIPGC